jgi:ferric-dicitrate binding protein FerR (iron transport regulator)
MAGDTVTAGTNAATIRFTDGSVVTLMPNARVKVQEKKKDDLSLQLLNGSMSFVLSRSSALQVYSGSTLVPAQPGVMATASAGVSASATNKIAPVQPPAPPTLSRY